jgi:hypothetical protein
MSVPDLKKVYRNLRGKISDARNQVWQKLGLKLKLYKTKTRYRLFRQYLRQNWGTTYKPALDYVFNEFLWITLANGLILNIVFDYFLGFPLTIYSVVAWGSLWYVFTKMTPSLRKEA